MFICGRGSGSLVARSLGKMQTGYFPPCDEPGTPYNKHEPEYYEMVVDQWEYSLTEYINNIIHSNGVGSSNEKE